MKKLDKNDILNLRLEFSLDNSGMKMVDWFTITEGVHFCDIQSGLRHTDGETKSPFHYSVNVVGKNATKTAIENFNEWFNSLDILNK